MYEIACYTRMVATGRAALHFLFFLYYSLAATTPHLHMVEVGDYHADKSQS